MQSKKLIPVTAAALLLAACADDDGIGAIQPDAVSSSPVVPVHASAELVDREGSVLGTAEFTDEDNGVLVTVDVHGMAPGPHDVYLLDGGRCEVADTGSASPTSPGDGGQIVDLPVLQVTELEVGSLSTLVGSVDLGDLLAGDGTAVFVDAGADDAVTSAGSSEPGHSVARSGASTTRGSQVACGVIGQ